MKRSKTKERAIKYGRNLLQLHGYNGFSFQDIAKQLNIKKPSLYDHFVSKDELILEIIKSYSDSFDMWLQSIEQKEPIEKIKKVFEVFYSFASDHHKICPILALSSDTDVPSKEIKKAMLAFIDRWLTWLKTQIEEGQKSGNIRKDMDAAELAKFIYSQGIGSQLQSRLKKQTDLPLISGTMIIELIRNQ